MEKKDKLNQEAAEQTRNAQETTTPEDPQTPWREEIIQSLQKDYPKLTRERIIEELDEFGF